MAVASLASYDGSAGTLVDTNIWIHCIDQSSPWHEWSMNQLQFFSERSPLHINVMIYTELLVLGPSITALDSLLDVYETLRRPKAAGCARSHTHQAVNPAPESTGPEPKARCKSSR